MSASTLKSRIWGNVCARNVAFINSNVNTTHKLKTEIIQVQPAPFPASSHLYQQIFKLLFLKLHLTTNINTLHFVSIQLIRRFPICLFANSCLVWLLIFKVALKKVSQNNWYYYYSNYVFTSHTSASCIWMEEVSMNSEALK